jgi:hypothetical protein
MILRRLGAAIARQDWFVIVIELVVLVLGIFIGLQVDDWNQARKDRIDEQRFLHALHDDILVAEELSSRVRQRRLEKRQYLAIASDVLHGRAQRDELTELECNAVGSSSWINITASGLSAFDELVASGRLGIVRNSDLRSALIGLQQSHQALATMIATHSASGAFAYLPVKFPELIKAVTYFDVGMGEISTAMECDLEAMRASQAFLNQWSANADGYDGYVRDGLKPWSDQLDRVHAIVDGMLKVAH